MDEGELNDEGGVAAAGIRLDETIHAPGDVLSYLYDYGDVWDSSCDSRMCDQRARTRRRRSPSTAAVLHPRRTAAACEAQSTLGEVLEDPSAFSLSDVNEALRDPSMLLIREGFDPRLAELVYRLAYTTGIRGVCEPASCRR